VLSQAYDRRLPILEANSERVLCRLFGIGRNPKDSDVRNQLWQLAESLLPRKKAGDFNQALMELGALVCKPSNPGCHDCPLRGQCRASSQNRQHEIPRRARPAKTVDVEEVALIVRTRDRLLLVQRPASGRWANMWEFPHHPRGPEESCESAARRLLSALGIEGELLGDIATIRHSVTRFRITMTCLNVKHRRGSPRSGPYPTIAWVRAEELHAYPLSTPQRRLARFLQSGVIGESPTPTLPRVDKSSKNTPQPDACQ
jgi:A/G-specific adenine glycosylase